MRATSRFGARLMRLHMPGWIVQRPALVLFVLAASVYLLTAGVSRNGVGYSADGTFAFEMAKSVVVDPDQKYLREHGGNFSRWGVGLPLALMPVVAAAEPFAHLAPQRDRLPILDGEHEMLLVNYAPLGGLPQPKSTGVLELGLDPGRYDRLALLTHAGLSTDFPQGLEVASLILTAADGAEIVRPVRVGIETAEWAYDRGDVRARIQHERPPPAGRQIGNARAYYYLATWDFPEAVDLESARLEYRQPDGNLYVDGVAARLVDGAWVDGPGIGRLWSERQTVDFFRRIWVPLVNALITAFGAVVVFRIVRRLDYGVDIALAIGLIYALATMAWPYAVVDFAEPLVTALVLTCVWLLLIYHQTHLRRYLLLAGTVALAAAVTKYVSVIVMPLLVAAIFLNHKRGRTWRQAGRQGFMPALAFSAPIIAVVPVGLVAAAFLFDVRLLYVHELWGGISRGWLGLPIELGVHGLISSWGKGLLWYNPVLLVAIPAIPWFIRRHGWRAFIFVAIPIGYLLLYSKKEVWYGGNAWGPRYLVPVVPFLVIMAAPLIEWLAHKGRRALPRAAFAVVLLASLGVQVMGVSKDFGSYLDLYQQQVVGELPENGAVYGGAAYQPWSAKQPEGDFVAVFYAHQFSPLLAHAWLLRADATNLLAPDRTDLLEDALARSPWSRFGIDVRPPRPENGLGLDFWSTTLIEYYLAYPVVLALAALILVALQVISVGALAAATHLLWPHGPHAVRWRLGIVGVYAAVLLAFDTLHFML